MESLSEIVSLRHGIGRLDPEGPPEAVLVAGRLPPGCRRVGVLPGSFNPPTNAHWRLAEGALESAGLDAVLILLSVRTVDKEQVTRLRLEDRVIALRRLIGDRPNLGAVATNRGLYVDQAGALRQALLPPPTEIVFLVGFDKIVQIFDPKYYQDRDAALRRLLAEAHILVAPREGRTDRDLADLLARPENRAFTTAVAPLSLLPGAIDPDLSATRVREAIAAGRPPAGIPPAVAEFLHEVGAFESDQVLAGGEPINRYELRHRIVDELSPRAGSPGGEETFQRWLAVAGAPTAEGQALRRRLRAGHGIPR